MTVYTASEMGKLKEKLGLRLTAYQDPDGIWNIGYRHTKGVKPGDTCTAEQAEKWLEEDLKEGSFTEEDSCSSAWRQLIHGGRPWLK